ncbi:SRPBCC family protein [Actinokineospora diospyrosa]|uniref:Carbon monoxide dehydrogenase subunit G n=1 Tax=Actinokineospora diospyrosa TaxID=103728 RepID=A0ABT1IHW9_9PSEU|nr:SRPBCC family protein [Actinokineospora diospyrosa]MCP2271861.1 Carbon monoxide dehydrogenase subunit G [Actinokineospora diospyrosa]
MQLEHQFTVSAPLAVVWTALLDPQRVAPCMPGATLTEVDGDSFTGTVKVKLGPISLLYKGNGRFLDRDEQAGKLVIKATGKDSRGNGTAAATVTVTLAEDGATTTGTVHTDLAITGKPAQFGRGLIVEVGGKILDTFATCLADKLAPAAEPPAVEPPAAEPLAEDPAEPDSADLDSADPEPAGSEPEPQQPEQVKPPTPEPPRVEEAEPVDLLEYAGKSVAKRALPVVVALVALVVVLLVRRGRR